MRWLFIGFAPLLYSSCLFPETPPDSPPEPQIQAPAPQPPALPPEPFQNTPLPPASSHLTSDLAYDWHTHGDSGPAALTLILDTEVLGILADHGYGFRDTIRAGEHGETTAELYTHSARYRAFADRVGQPIGHIPSTDQLPKDIPAQSGDIPQVVSLLRNFEDKGKRSSKDLKGGFFIRHLANNSQYPYQVEYDGDEPRHFDYRWLNSSFSSFQLIAVVNRLDRAAMSPSSCGEVRFVYRLAYQSEQSRSSLPFVVNAVFEFPKAGDCSALAQTWRVDPKFSGWLRSEGDKAPTHLANHLASRVLKGARFKQLELNYQAVRFTSGYMHDLGGQAMYIQRIVRPDGDSFAPIPLENTPDVLAIQQRPELLHQFVAYLNDPNRLKELDQGTLVVDFDPAFLATTSVSWSTLGRARLANKPYRQLFQGKEDLLASIDLSGLSHIQSHDGLLERLDNLTCMGCHQSSGTAGFHMLGFAQEAYSHGFNKQELPYSPHVFAELARRQAYTHAVAEGSPPNDFRPHSNFPPAQWRTGTEPEFEAVPVRGLCLPSGAHLAGGPACAPLNGLDTECKRNVTSSNGADLFGECVLKPMATAAHYFAGGTCFGGEIKDQLTLPTDRGPIPSFNTFAFQDKLALGRSLHPNRSGPDKAHRYGCGSPKGGAPLGRRGRRCLVEEETLSVLDGFVPKGESPVTLQAFQGGQIPTEICANQGGNGFDMCAARGDSGSCLQARVARAMLDTCYPGAFCREDYICQKLPDYHLISAPHYGRVRNGVPVNQTTPDRIQGDALVQLRDENVGFCVPTYFLFNMRVDGHPSPVTGKSPGTPRIDRSQPLRGYP